MKHLAKLLILLLLLFVLAACGAEDATPMAEEEAPAVEEEAPAVEEEAPAPTGVTLGLSLSTLNNPFFVTLGDGAQEAADAAGVELVVVDAQDDPAQEATNIEDLIQQGVSAILVNPTDADAIVPSIQKANEASIPVFTIDRGAAGGEVVAHIASDNVAGGMLAGEFLCDAIGGEGKAVELEGIAGTSAARDRGQGFNDYLASSCSGVEVIARQTANFNRAEGLTVFENILQAEPEIDAVFAHNDEMILGAIEAAKAAGRDGEIVFVGFDAVDDAVAAVDAGDLAATIAQQPDVMGQLGVDTALAHLDGQSVDDFTPVDLALVSGDGAMVEAPEGLVFGLSLSTLNNPFFVTLGDGAQAAADSAGIELVVVDAQDDPAQEATNMEDLIQRGVSAILVNPTDADAIVPSIQKANEAGIPVFTIDRGAAGGEVVAHIASDNVAGGMLAGEFLCDAIGGEGQAVELEGIAGTSAARDRGQGFNDYLASSCSGVEVIARQTANFNRAEGLTVFENILQAEPEIDAVFAHNDEMILGAIEAAKAAGRDGEILFVGFDAVDDAVAAVDAGDLAATIAQQPAVMGQLGVETAAAFLGGASVDDFTPVDLALVAGEGGAAAAPMGDYVLGLSLSTLNNPFFVTLGDGAQGAADTAGSELIVVDAQDDPAQEATNMEDLIQRGVDAILVNPTDADAIVPSIQKANEAGIPVFTIDRGAAGGEVVAHIASDNVAGGMMAGEFLCESLGGEGKVVELEGIAGTSAARDRGEGFNEYMSGECPGVEIIARQTANFNRAEGLSVFENILQAEPEIDGVFAHNDEMILGAIEAAKAAGRDGEIIFVGFDAVDDAVAAVDAGDLAATIAQQPAVMGQLGVETAVIFLNGGTVEEFTGVDLSLVK
jgi:ribose transport system substrate-binding protein